MMQLAIMPGMSQQPFLLLPDGRRLDVADAVLTVENRYLPVPDGSPLGNLAYLSSVLTATMPSPEALLRGSVVLLGADGMGATGKERLRVSLELAVVSCRQLAGNLYGLVLTNDRQKLYDAHLETLVLGEAHWPEEADKPIVSERTTS